MVDNDDFEDLELLVRKAVTAAAVCSARAEVPEKEEPRARRSEWLRPSERLEWAGRSRFHTTTHFSEEVEGQLSPAAKSLTSVTAAVPAAEASPSQKTYVGGAAGAMNEGISRVQAKLDEARRLGGAVQQMNLDDRKSTGVSCNPRGRSMVQLDS